MSGRVVISAFTTQKILRLLPVGEPGLTPREVHRLYGKGSKETVYSVLRKARDDGICDCMIGNRPHDTTYWRVGD